MKIVYWPYIFLAFFSLFALGLMDNSRGAFFPEIMQDFQLTHVKAASLFAIPSLVSLLGSLAAPKIVYKWGVVFCLRLGLFFLSLGLMGLSQATAYWEMNFWCSSLGLSFGLIGVGQHIAIELGGVPEHKRQLFAGLHSMYAFSSLMAPLLGKLMIFYGLSWRIAFFLISALVFSIFLCSFAVRPKFKISGRDSGKNSGKEKGATPAEKAPPLESKEPRVYGHAPLIIFSLFVSFYVASELLLTSRLVLFMQKVHGVSEAVSQNYLFSFFLCFLLARVFFTACSMSRRSTKFLLVVFLILSITTYTLGVWADPYFLVASGLTMAPLFAFCMGYLGEIFCQAPKRAFGYCISVISVVVLAMHYFVGWLTQEVGLGKAMFVGPSLLILSLVALVIFLPRILKSQDPRVLES